MARSSSVASLALALFAAGAVQAQPAPIHGHWEIHSLWSGNCPNPGTIAMPVFQRLVIVDPSVPWMRLHFTRAHLGKGSFLRVTSMLDGDVQTLHQNHLEQWGLSTAFFNGNALLVEIVGGAGTQKNFIESTKIWAGDGHPHDPPPETICGSADNRVPSSNPAVGRLLTSSLQAGCTGWIVDQPTSGNDRCHLSAGHCFPNSAVLQFGVPASSATCAMAHPPASRQFAVDQSTMISVNAGVGADYAAFRCFANSSTGLTTFQTQGAAIALQAGTPAAGATLRITGFGVDGTNVNNAGGGNASCACSSTLGTGQRNKTQQTHTGPFASATSTTARYQVDTCGGSSGSPVFDDTTGRAIAIHTNGGCWDPVSGTSNAGTRVSISGVQSAITSLCAVADNDECDGSVPVFDGVNGPFTNAGSTTSLPTWSCGAPGNDVWFSYVATCSGSVMFDTGSATTTFDTVLEVFSGSCFVLNSIACDDDSGPGLTSRVTVSVASNTTYFIRVGGHLGATGPFDLTVTGCSSADECPDAVSLRLGTNGPFSSGIATTSTPAWPCGLNTGNDMWFAYDVDCGNVEVTFSTCSLTTDFDTVLEVFGGRCGSLASLACNDDDAGCRNTVASTASVILTSPRLLLVRVGGYNGAQGIFELRVSLEPTNDDCASSITVTEGVNGPFCSVGATDSLAWPCGSGGSDVWFSYTASCDGELVVDTCSATLNFDTTLEVFSGSCGSLVSLACNDDACGLGSILGVPATAGANYWIRVGGFGGQQGEFDLALSCQVPNDECIDAITIVDGVNGPYSSVGATASPPSWACGLNVGSDVWFRYVAACSAPVTFDTCSGTLNFDSVIEVFGGSCGAVVSLACNDDACGLGSEVIADLAQGGTYYIRVGGFNGGQGEFDLTAQLGTGTGGFQRRAIGCGSLTIMESGWPNIGGTVDFQLGGITGIPLIAVGANLISVPICPGCVLGVDPITVPPGATLSIPIPCNAALIGGAVGFQGVDVASVGGCVTPVQLSVSDLVILTIG